LVLFLAKQEKYITQALGIFYSKRFPQALWNVEKICVENSAEKYFPTGVKFSCGKLLLSTQAAVDKNPLRL
jgi:hypothetical protein